MSIAEKETVELKVFYLFKFSKWRKKFKFKFWKASKPKKVSEPSLAFCLIQVFCGKFMAGAFLKLVHDLLLLSSPLILKYQKYYFNYMIFLILQFLVY